MRNAVARSNAFDQGNAARILLVVNHPTPVKNQAAHGSCRRHGKWEGWDYCAHAARAWMILSFAIATLLAASTSLSESAQPQSHVHIDQAEHALIEATNAGIRVGTVATEMESIDLVLEFFELA